MADFRVVATRGSLTETSHRVSVAVVSADGELIGQAGDPETVTYWRSAAKPFQLLPLVEDGGIEHFDLDDSLLALACASHNAELVHRQTGARWLTAIGAAEHELACGGHPSISSKVAEAMIRDGVTPTPLWSNCSGKHSSLLAQAKLRGWSTSGYEARPHPVQARVAAVIAKWTRSPVDSLGWGIDGCTAAAVALPLRAMATAYAALGTSADSSLRRIRDAMMAQPFLIAGTGRLDTAIMQGWPGRVIAKVGADGVYSAVLPSLGIGLALKVDDGNTGATCQALVAVMRALVDRYGASDQWPTDALLPWQDPPIRNTRGVVTGHGRVEGSLEWA